MINFCISFLVTSLKFSSPKKLFSTTTRFIFHPRRRFFDPASKISTSEIFPGTIQHFWLSRLLNPLQRTTKSWRNVNRFFIFLLYIYFIINKKVYFTKREKFLLQWNERDTVALSLSMSMRLTSRSLRKNV